MVRTQPSTGPSLRRVSAGPHCGSSTRGGLALSAVRTGSRTHWGVDIGDLYRAAEELLEKVIGEVVGEVKDVKIERQVVQGSAAEVLVGAVAAGDLLVVGSRGHGGFAGLLLGSVSQQCVHHAPCTVVVVHPPKRTARARELAHAAPTKPRAASPRGR
jgi:nucleotide-binding universal stress UspA family protein